MEELEIRKTEWPSILNGMSSDTFNCSSYSNIHGLARIFKRQDLFSYALLPMHGISMVCCRQKLAKIFRLVNFSGFSSNQELVFTRAFQMV